jgi:hypothetical protein
VFARRVVEVALLVLLVLSLAALYVVHGQLTRTQQEIHRRIEADYLEPIAELLKHEQAVLAQLAKDESAKDRAPDADVLASYLADIRRDGVARHSATKLEIDDLMNTNTTILALLAKYSPYVQTATFRASAERFREYALAARDRWQSLLEIFMAGGSLPASAPPFPVEFPEALQVEMRSVR